MSLRASRGGRSGHTHAATVVEEDTPTLTPAQPFRRTRSQALRDEAEQQQQQQQQPASSSDVPASAIPQEEDPNLRTPKKRATRTSIAAAASAAAARLGKLSPVTVSPSLRMRTIEMVDSVAAACEKYQLLAFDAVPEWLRDNKYIRRGYRANLGWRHSFESVCHLHNETVNVWTHLIGFLLMTCILIGTMMVLSPHGVDRLDLIVDLQSQPVCEPMADGSANPLCTAAHGSAAPSNVVRAADDPLELLHQILGDHQDEMLIELLSRVQTHVPDMQQLTQTLKAKASEIQASLLQHIPEEVIKVTDETSLSFTDYLTRMESKLGEVKESVSELLTPEVKHRAQAASLRVQEEFLKLQSTLSDFSREYSPELLLFSSPRHLDLISVTQKVIDRFMDQSHFRGGFSLSPTLVARPGVKVRVRSPVEGMPHLGSGSVFAHGLDDIEDDLEQGEIGEESQRGKKLIDAHSHSHTTLDEDGLGKTTSTAIGYMSIEAHTSTKKPGQVQLQLHSYLPRYPLAIFLVTAMMCLFFSSAYHLLHAVSDIWARRFQALDYAGIVLLIAGSTHPLIYYGFYCSPRLKWTYISIVWLLALVVFAIVVLPSFRHVQFRGLKVGCFIGLGLAGMVPFMHFCIHLGEIHFTFYWLLAMGACYIGGAMIYLFQVPERWFPGYFDFFFSSHQLWHLSIFAAVLVHYFAVLHHFEWRMNRVCTPTMWS